MQGKYTHHDLVVSGQMSTHMVKLGILVAHLVFKSISWANEEGNFKVGWSVCILNHPNEDEISKHTTKTYLFAWVKLSMVKQYMETRGVHSDITKLKLNSN